MIETALSFDIANSNLFDYEAIVGHAPLSPGNCNFMPTTSPPLSLDSYASPDDKNGNHGKCSSSGKRSQKRGVSTFITKLYGMVDDQRYQQLISWNPSGTSFFVYNATLFSESVLPVHFKHSNFSSFVRQLNMYGFHKINKSLRGQRGLNENEVWEFSHGKFQHGRPELLEDIKRKAMDSEMLRRETGDIHASFGMLQLAQTDLLQQFTTLQDRYSNLLQSFEELKKIQLQQQIALRELTRSSASSGKTQIQYPFSLATDAQWQQQQQNDTLPLMYSPESMTLSSSNLGPLPPSPVLSDPSSQSFDTAYSKDLPCHPHQSIYVTDAGFTPNHLSL